MSETKAAPEYCNDTNNVATQDQSEFDTMIGELDTLLSKLLILSKQGNLKDFNRATMVHHAEDMIGAAVKVLVRLQAKLKPEMSLRVLCVSDIFPKPAQVDGDYDQRLQRFRDSVRNNSVWTQNTVDWLCELAQLCFPSQLPASYRATVFNSKPPKHPNCTCTCTCPEPATHAPTA